MRRNAMHQHKHKPAPKADPLIEFMCGHLHEMREIRLAILRCEKALKLRAGDLSPEAAAVFADVTSDLGKVLPRKEIP